MKDTKTPWPGLPELLDGLEFKMHDTAEAERAREKFVSYAHTITSGSELTLDIYADRATYLSEWSAIFRKAFIFTQMEVDFEHMPLNRNSSDRAMWTALKTLDAYMGGIELTKSQRAQMKDFFKQANHLDTKVTIEEIVDLAAHEDCLIAQPAYEALASTLGCARLLLERLGVEPTRLRLHALSRRAEAVHLGRTDGRGSGRDRGLPNGETDTEQHASDEAPRRLLV
jgi:hypothetical protein